MEVIRYPPVVTTVAPDEHLQWLDVTRGLRRDAKRAAIDQRCHPPVRTFAYRTRRI